MKLKWYLVILLCIPVMASAGNRFPAPSVMEDTIQTNQVKVQWEKQTRVKRYVLRLFDKTCTSRIKQYEIHKKRTKKVLKNLTADTKYCFRMRAEYKNGTHDHFSKRTKFRTLTEVIEEPEDPVEVEYPTMRFGVNFIRYQSDDTEALAAATQPDVIDADFTTLGVGAFRQITSADLIWSQVEPYDNQYDFSDSDAVLTTTTHEPIVDLFSYQYADSTTPWDELMGDTNPEVTLTAEAEDYIGTTVDRYKDYVTYWEIGNEMMHWQLTEGDAAFSIADQAHWLAAVSAEVREHDPDAQIVLPGLVNITPDNVDDWLPEIVEVAGSDWFDIVGYHDYNRWQQFQGDRAALQAVLEDLNITDKPVWMTETGTTSDPSNTRITDYPNSAEQQAADIFRRALLSYAAGDELMIWHTYIGNDTAGDEFRYFGLINDDITPQLAYYSAQLLTSELLPYAGIENQGDFVYRVARADGSNRYVAWSATEANWQIPDGATEMTSVVPNADGTFAWTAVTPGDTITLTDIPVLVR